MRRVLAIAFWVFLAVQAAADLPPLKGADETYSEATRGEDPLAIANYVTPLLRLPNLDAQEAEQLETYLRRAYDLWSRRSADSYSRAWAAHEIALLKLRFFKLHQTLEWVALCVEPTAKIHGDYARNLRIACEETGGRALLEMSRYAEARVVFGQLLAELAEPARTDPQLRAWRASIRVRDGTALDGLQRHLEAVELYKQSLAEITEIEGADSYSATIAILNIGAAYWWAGELEPARDWTLRGLPLIDRHDGVLAGTAAATRVNLALIAHDLGHDEEAMNWGIAVLPHIAAYPEQSLSLQRWTFEFFRRAFVRRAETDRAILFGKMAVNAQQQLRQRNAAFGEAGSAELRAEWSRLYEELADLLIAEGRFSEAQSVLNMEKEQEAFEFLQRDASAALAETEATLTDEELSEQDKLSALAATPVAARQAWRALSDKLDAGGGTDADVDRLFLLEDALAEAEARYLQEVEAFLTDVPEVQRQSFGAQFDAIGSYQATLRAKERPSAILQLALLDDATHLFLTLPGTSVHAEVPVGRAEMRRAVFETLQAIEGRKPEAQAQLAALYNSLIAPVREALDIAGTEVIMINAGDVLRYVPFAALHDGDSYLVEDFAFALYVAAVNTQFSRPDRAPDSAAGFGVTQAHGDFDALPGVAAEIETLFTATDGQGVLAGQTALDAAFDTRALRMTLRDPPQVLHIASHFALQPGRDDASKLLLGDGTELPLSELRSAKFRFAGVDLLTLSACQTAVGGGDGSEIDGFGAAALNNGASAVMASLWPVADKATPLLMEDFYSGLLTDGLDKAEALRRAQIAMLRGAQQDGTAQTERAAKARQRPSGAGAAQVGYEHPYFWSAFVIMGNWL